MNRADGDEAESRVEQEQEATEKAKEEVAMTEKNVISELATLKLSQLRQRALDADCHADEVDEAIDSANPREALAELVHALVSRDQGVTRDQLLVADDHSKMDSTVGCIENNGVLQFMGGSMPAQTGLTGRFDWESERSLCSQKSLSYLRQMASGDECIDPGKGLPPLRVSKSSRRILVIMLCSTRANKLTWDSLKENVLDHLDADLALSVSVTGGSSSATRDDRLRQNAKFIWEVQDPHKNDYGSLYKTLAKTCGNLSFDIGTLNCQNVFGGIGGKPGSGAMLWYFRYIALQAVIQHAEEMQGYTHFVLTRSDYNYTAPHPRGLSDDSLMIPEGEDYGGITDRHTVVPRALLPAATAMLFDMVTKSNRKWCDGVNNPEGLLKKWYKDRGLKIKRFPRTMYAVKSKNTQQATHWSHGHTHSDFGDDIQIKYPQEYELAKRTAEDLRKCREQPSKECLGKFAYWQSQSFVGLTSTLDDVSPTDVQIFTSVISAVAPWLMILFAIPFQGDPRVRTFRDGAGFMFCSASLLLSNKWTVTFTNAPVLVTFCQLAFTSVAVLSARAVKLVELNDFEWAHAKAFAIIGATFLVVVAMSNFILVGANLETMITIRASAVVVVCILEMIFLGKEMPSLRSAFCLFVCVCASVLFGALESNGSYTFTMTSGILCWYVSFCFDQIYIKHTISDLKLTTWTNVAYTNTIAAILLCPFAYYEYSHGQVLFSRRSIVLLAATCVLGIGMSYFAYAARDRFSATMFTMLGNVCKTGSIVGNQLLWDMHASAGSVFCAFLVLGSAFAYDESKRLPSKDFHAAKGLGKGSVQDGQVVGGQPQVVK